jgi:hypothetical protein
MTFLLEAVAARPEPDSGAL